MEGDDILDYKTENIDRIMPLVEEMGDGRFKQYMKAYLELGKDSHYFFDKFAAYIDQCKKNKNDYKIMSVMTFKNFLLDMPLMEEFKKIWIISKIHLMNFSNVNNIKIRYLIGGNIA